MSGMSAADFGTDFTWGVATASYQIEGAPDADGKGRSVWDDFTHGRGPFGLPRIKGDANGDVATDSYHRYEEDIALVRAGAKALGRTRGAVVDDIPLEILRIEPFARGKNQLTGANAERVDTRVIEVLLRVDSSSTRTLYPGQAVDVYIEGPAR